MADKQEIMNVTSKITARANRAKGFPREDGGYGPTERTPPYRNR